jgi:hypothetical protein
MAGLAKYVQWVWALSVAAQVAVCVVLFLTGNFRRIPGVTAYLVSNVCQAGLLYGIYYHFGFRTWRSVVLAWSSELVTLMLRVIATAEILRVILRPFRGIWGLAWRVLAAAFGGVFVVALIDSGRNLTWAVVLADRGFHLAFAVALIACLLLIHYYVVPVHPVYKVLLGGFCFYSCTVVLANTLGGTLFLRGNVDYQRIWQLATTVAFVAVMLVWAVALRVPIPKLANQPEPLAAKGLYLEKSLQINERLRLLNEQLNRLWKPEATRH